MKLRLLYISLAAALFTGCIHNDIPSPYIEGRVTEFEVEGQIENTINSSTNTIEVVMGEEIDIREAKITKFEMNEVDEAKTTTTLNHAAAINLSKTVDFKINIFRDWDWKITTTQPIERYINVDNQVGSARIDVEAKTAVILMPDNYDMSNLNITGLKLATSVAEYSKDVADMKDFTQPITVDATFWGTTETWTITAEVTTVVTKQVDEFDVWATFTTIEGAAASSTKLNPTFEYRIKGSEDAWTAVDPDKIEENGDMSVKLTGLQPDTEYVYRAALVDSYGEELEFKTESDVITVPNMNLDTWLYDKTNPASNYSKYTWYPNIDRSEENIFWATANEGTMIAAKGSFGTYPTGEEDAYRGANGAKLMSLKIPKGTIDLYPPMAAGNLFTGTFKTMVPAPLTSAKFSRPYKDNNRPTTFSFWYKTDIKMIDIFGTKDIHKEEYEGQSDRCNFKVFLGDWEADILYSTDFKGLETDGLIAYAEFETSESVSVYTQKILNLQYVRKDVRPTKIIIVASSSYLGDIFVGGGNSTFWLDEFEFGFDAVD